MKKIIKLIIFLMAVAVVTFSGAAFSGGLICPGDLSAPMDSHLILDDGYQCYLDMKPQNGGCYYCFEEIVAQDKDKTDDINFLDFNAILTLGGIPMSLSNDYGEYLTKCCDHSCIYDRMEEVFNKLLIRTVDGTVEINFDVHANWTGIYNWPFKFGLVGGYEFTVSPTDRVLAQDCTLACENFYHYMPHGRFVKDVIPFVSMSDFITWTGEGDKEFYVECCSNLALAISRDRLEYYPDLRPEHYSWTSCSLDMVIAHLSEVPFLRVRITEAMNVGKQCQDCNGKIVNGMPYLVKVRDFRAWRESMYFDSIVDIPEGETYNMGVQYATNTECDCCSVGACCENPHIPYIAVTNLGTESVFTGKNLTDTEGLVLWDNDSKVFSNTSWLCNSWCGLCLYDDFTSGEKGLLGAGKYENIADQSSLSDCPCHIYPAFTNTVLAAGNMDINYRAYKTDECLVLDPLTRIQGRFNTSWSRYRVSDLCDCCYYLYDPCDCLVEMYRNAIDWDVDFVDKEYLYCIDFNDSLDYDPDATDKDCAVFDVEVGDSASKDILLARLDWTVPAECLVEAGLVDGENWWRADLWNKLSIRINGMTLNAANVENVSANDLTPEELSFLTVVDGPQRDLTVATDIDVKLFLFVIDSDDSAIRYYKNAKGNRFLVLYDGSRDGIFTYKGYISKDGSGPTPTPPEFDVTVSSLLLNLAIPGEESKELGTLNVPLGAEVVWTVTSTDLAMVSPDSGPVTTVMGLQVGEVIVTAMISGDEDVSADCLVTIEDDPTPTPTPGGGSGGCNAAGFAPAMLLLMVPLAVFLKK